MRRLSRALAWPALVAAAEAVYLLAFVRPYGLLDHFAKPGMDLGKLAGYSEEGGFGFLAAMGALFVIYAVAYRLAASGHGSATWILGGGLLLALTAAAVYPIGADDVFDNLYYGRMMAHFGANPLLTAPQTVPGDPLFAYVAWYWWPIPYGPVWAAVDGAVSRLTDGDLLAGLLAFKAMAVALYAACSLLIWDLLGRLRPRFRDAGTLLFAWSPLVILEGMANAHNDLALMALALGAVALLARGRSLWGLGLLLASVLVKFVPLVLAPMYLIAGWRTARGRWQYALGAVGLATVAALALYLPYRLPDDILSDLVMRPFRQADLFTTSLPAVVNFVLEGRGDVPEPNALVRRVALGGWAMYAAWETVRLWRRSRQWPKGRGEASAAAPADVAAGSYRTLLYFLLFACLWFQPWYIIWLLALAPLLGPGRHVLTVTAFSVLAQIKYFVFDFAWFWRTPMDDLLVPEVVTTILVFGPLLAMMAAQTWSAWWRRREARGGKVSKYDIALEIYEGKGGELRKEDGQVVSPNFGKEGICAWMYRGDGERSYQQGERFAYPADSGKVCSWLLYAVQPFVQAIRYGGNLSWTYEGTPYQKEIDPDGVTTEYVRCPDPSASGIVVKIIRTKVGE